MTDATSRMAEDAVALQAAADRLHEDAMDRDCAPLVPAALSAIEHTLRVLSRACDAAAHSLVPRGGHDESIARRYARAADDWPAARAGRRPSHEQQARVLSSLDDAGAALRSAAARCHRASDDLAATMEPASAHAARATPPSVALPTASGL